MKHPSQNGITFAVIEFLEFYMDHDMARKIAIMITIQIKILDAIWSKVSLFVTERENHKTENRFQQSLVFKTVIVKFFNALYPFIYFAFAKAYVEGCKGNKGCIPGLQMYIMTFFV